MEKFALFVESMLGHSPYVPDTLYMFCGRRIDRIKCLVWEGDGRLLLYKRLQDGKFQWPRSESEVRSLTLQQWSIMESQDNRIKKLENENQQWRELAERLRAENQMLWVEMMNNIRASAD